VVCLRARDTWAGLHACLGSVLAHTEREISILLWGADDTDLVRARTGVQSRRSPETDREVLLGAGPGATLVAITSPADLVLLDTDFEVAAGWLQALTRAAYSDGAVAIAVAMSSGSLPTGLGFDDAAAAVRSRSMRLRPRVAVVREPCAFIRRSGLELAGELEAARGVDDLSSLSRRSIDLGLSMVLADDVLVNHHGPPGYAPSGPAAEHCPGALKRSLSRARRALGGLSVIVDARILTVPPTGTQVHILEVIAALARSEEIRLSALVSDRLGDQLRQTLSSMSGLSLISDSQARAANRARADVVHRPYQIDNPGELTFLQGLADRLVITHQDLIGYHNPSYFGSPAEWQGYRELTRSALAVADRVLFFSAHTRDDALNEELVEPDRTTVVRLGVDHRVVGRAPRPSPPSRLAEVEPDAAILLCIGNDYSHKNRPFALRLLQELRSGHHWGGSLAVAGPHVPHGSSADDERRVFEQWPDLKRAVFDLGVVSEPEKEWLLGRAGLVLYPTVHEGFGLVPFEAADHGVPCMWAPGTSLSELLGDGASSIVPWDVQATGERALALLNDPGERERNLEAIRTAGRSLTWDETATGLIQIYETTCDHPASPAGELRRRAGPAHGGLSEDAMRLLGPGGALSSDVERPLLALATHPRIGDPVFAALKLGYRTSYRLRRGTRRLRWR
jgi:glycosyltransferase involved in cell wall biosynthesis